MSTSFNGIWNPMASSANSNPTDRDHNLATNSALVQAARINYTFMSRLVENASPLFAMNGKVARQARFTITGGIGVETHQKGDRFQGMNRDSIQRELNLDERPYINTIKEENITQMFEQVDVKFDTLTQMGNAHASRDEVECMKAILDASATGAVGSEDTTEFLTGGGSIAVGTTPGETKALAILAAIEAQVIKWGQQGVDGMGRNCLVTPEDYWQILKLEKAATGLTAIAGGLYGNADIMHDKISFADHVNSEAPLRWRGVNIWQHNLINATYDKHNKGLKAVHDIESEHNNRGSTFAPDGDFTDVQGLLWQQGAVGKSDVMSINFRQGDVAESTEEYITAMSWIGYGTLKPQAAVALTGS